jgi:alcohol dehydrogenase, propanol-preferring
VHAVTAVRLPFRFMMHLTKLSLLAACLAAPAADGLCFNRKISGYYFPGSFQQYAIGPATYVTKIPDGLSSEVAAPMLCAGVTTYTALRKSGAKSGQWVVIAGAGGGLGHIATQLSAKGMAHRVIGIDAGAKEKLVLESGAEHFLDIGKFKDDDSIVEEVKKLTGGLGAHAAIVCTSSNRAYAQALRFLRFNGTLVCVGIPEGGLVPIASADPFSLVVEQKTITAVAVGNREEANEVLAFAARGVVKADVRIEPMEKLTDVFKEMEKGQLSGRVVLDLS